MNSQGQVNPDAALVLERIASALERLASVDKSAPQEKPLRYSDVPTFYPAITERMIAEACKQPNGPRPCGRGIVTVAEIDAWLRRQAQAKGVRN